MKKTALKSGETLVEVLAAAAIFLLMMGIMQGAISFCTNTQHKSEAIRKINAGICESLRSKTFDTPSPGTTAAYSFKAISADGQQESGVLFKVDVGLGTKTADYTDETGTDKTITFYLFQSAAPVLPNGGGGGAP